MQTITNISVAQKNMKIFTTGQKIQFSEYVCKIININMLISIWQGWKTAVKNLGF